LCCSQKKPSPIWHLHATTPPSNLFSTIGITGQKKGTQNKIYKHGEGCTACTTSVLHIYQTKLSIKPTWPHTSLKRSTCIFNKINICQLIRLTPCNSRNRILSISNEIDAIYFMKKILKLGNDSCTTSAQQVYNPKTHWGETYTLGLRVVHLLCTSSIFSIYTLDIPTSNPKFSFKMHSILNEMEQFSHK